MSLRDWAFRLGLSASPSFWRRGVRLRANKGLKRTIPDAKIIGMSGGGYADKDEVLDMQARLGAQYTIAKPLRQKELVAIVRQALAS